MSAGHTMSAESVSIELGAQDYLTKPFQKNDLEVVIQQCLGGAATVTASFASGATCAASSSAATRAVSGGKVRDSQSGYRAMKADVLRKVHGEGDRYEFETDFIIRAARAGFTTVNVPISTIYGSPSYFREFRDAWLVIKVLWRHRAGVLKR